MRFSRLAALAAVFLTVAAAAAPAPQQPETLKTGAAAPELPARAWLNGKPLKLGEFKGKKPVVLYFWTITQECASTFPNIAAIAKHYNQKVGFIGVGCEEPTKMKNFFRLKELPFPVIADDLLELVNLFLRDRDRVPTAVVIDQEGRVAWRGKVDTLPGVLEELLTGKFDLAGNIKREEFSNEVMEAMEKKEYEKVLKLITKELESYPGNMELIGLKAKVLSQALGRTDDALAFLEQEHKTAPKNVQIYELAFGILKDAGLFDRNELWCDRLTVNFADQPMLLLQFAKQEMGRPVGEINLENAYKLTRAAYGAPKFANDREKGLAASEYARVLYFCGRPDLALEKGKEAAMLLKDAKESRMAREYVVYYNKILALSKQIR